jgi:transcriptional regulator
MHPHPAFRAKERDGLRAFAADIAFGTLFVATPEGPRVAHVPFVFLDDERIGFHLSRGNAITRHLDGAEALFVVNGPDGYVSPDWYGVDDQVGTWNYVALELQGAVRQMEEAELVAQIDMLSDIQESRLLPKPIWKREKMAEGQFEKMLRGIFGFEMAISVWRSTVKLGQHKGEDMRAAAANGVAAAGNAALAELMRNPPA